MWKNPTTSISRFPRHSRVFEKVRQHCFFCGFTRLKFAGDRKQNVRSPASGCGSLWEGCWRKRHAQLARTPAKYNTHTHTHTRCKIRKALALSLVLLSLFSSLLVSVLVCVFACQWWASVEAVQFTCSRPLAHIIHHTQTNSHLSHKHWTLLNRAQLNWTTVLG